MPDVSAPGPSVDLIEHAAGIIVAKKKEPHTAPYHWAGALWEAGMLVPPGHAGAGAAPVPDAGDDTLREQLRDILDTCTCTPPPIGDGPQIDCPMHGRADYQADALLPRIREHIVAAKQAERERLACGLDEMQTAYSGEVQRGIRTATILIRKISEAASG